jgi:hypothetical protein
MILWLASLGLRTSRRHFARPSAGDFMRYPSKSLEIPPETFSKVVLEKLL